MNELSRREMIQATAAAMGLVGLCSVGLLPKSGGAVPTLQEVIDRTPARDGKLRISGETFLVDGSHDFRCAEVTFHDCIIYMPLVLKDPPADFTRPTRIVWEGPQKFIAESLSVVSG